MTGAILMLVACSKPQIDPQASDDTSELLAGAELAEFITDRMARARVPGLAAALVYDGEVTAQGAWGLANVDEQKPVSTDTLFNLASVSKTVVSAAVMQAVEDGDLDLDADVNTVLPFEVDHPRSSREITLRMLLTHSSGISDNWDVLEPLYVEGDSPIALGDFLEAYLVRGGEYYDPDWNYDAAPGQVNDYSNVGSSLAAYMVEAATGTPFDEYCEQNIFTPLGMDNSSWHLAGLDVDEIAVPYEWVGGEWEAYAHYGYPDYPDGGLRTSAPQLARFLAAFTAGGAYEGTRILDEDTVDDMLSLQTPAIDDAQGLIWYSWWLGDDLVWGHNGGDDGVSTEILFRKSDGAGLVLLMNGTGGRWGPVEDIQQELLSLAR